MSLWRYKRSRIPRPIGFFEKKARLGPDPCVNHILNAPDEEMDLYADSAASFYNPDAIEPAECNDLEIFGIEHPYSYRPDFRIPERADGLSNIPFGPGEYPEIGDPVTGFGGPFGHHGFDWGQPFVADDFYTDAERTRCEPQDYPGMLMRGHIPPEEPDDWAFMDYIDLGQRACDEMVRHAEETGNYRAYPLPLTPAWCNIDGVTDLAMPWEPGVVPIENTMMEDVPGVSTGHVSTIRNPDFEARSPGFSEPPSGFGGPFTDNPELPFGPESYVTCDFEADAHDSGEEPGMRFPGQIPNQDPGELHFNRYMTVQDSMLRAAEEVEQVTGEPLSREHPFWRSEHAPGWTETAEYQGPMCHMRNSRRRRGADGRRDGPDFFC